MKAPDAYVALQRMAFEASETSSQWQNHYLELLGFYFAGAMPEYRADPPEMLVFGATGVDGIQIGYVVHAPELDLDDYLVVKSYPILGVAERALRAGTPGTALVISKNALYDDPDSPHADELRGLAARAYRQLGRRLHARRVLAESERPIPP